MKKSTKKHVVTLMAALMMVLSFAVPVYAAMETEPDELTRASSEYLPFDLTIYNGVYAFSSSAACTSMTALVHVTKMDNDLTGISVAIYPAIGNDKISVSKALHSVGDLTFSPASQYPGQYIRAGFYRIGITGAKNIQGRFYYNGL